MFFDIEFKKNETTGIKDVQIKSLFSIKNLNDNILNFDEYKNNFKLDCSKQNEPYTNFCENIVNDFMDMELDLQRAKRSMYEENKLKFYNYKNFYERFQINNRKELKVYKKFDSNNLVKYN